VYVDIYVYIYTYICVHIYVYIYIYVNIYMCIYICVCIYSREMFHVVGQESSAPQIFAINSADIFFKPFFNCLRFYISEVH